MFNERMKRLGESRSVIRELFEYGKALAAERGKDKVFDFSIGNPNIPAPEEVNESIVKNLGDPTVHGYTSAQGDEGVRKKLAAYFSQKMGGPLPADRMYLTAGAAAALTATFSALAGAGDEIVVSAPFFPEYAVFSETAGCKLVAVPSDANFEPDIEAIGRALNSRTAAVIVNSPNNPAGNVYSENTVRALCRLVEKRSRETGRRIFIVSDEPYREITYGTEAVSPVKFYDDTVVCYSFSKTLSLAGERIGFAAVSGRAENGDELFAAICGAGRALGYVCAPSVFQRVVADCVGKTADIAVYRHNRDLLYGIVSRLGFECVKPEGAFYLFVKCPIEPDAFFEICKDEGVLVVPSESFGIAGYVRLAYCVDTDTIVRSEPYFERVAQRCKAYRERAEK